MKHTNQISPSQTDDLQSPSLPLLQKKSFLDESSVQQNTHGPTDNSNILNKKDYQNFYSNIFNDNCLSTQNAVNKFLLQMPEWPEKEPTDPEIVEKYSSLKEVVHEYFNAPEEYSLCQPDHVIELKKNHCDHVFGCLISYDGLKVITFSEDCSIKIWDIGSKKCETTLRGNFN